MEGNEKFGTIVVDGKIINLDSTNLDELEKIEEGLEKQIDEIRNRIDEYIAAGDDTDEIEEF